MKKGKSKCGGIAHSPTKGSGRLLKLGYGKKIKGYKEGKKIKGYRSYQEGGDLKFNLVPNKVIKNINKEIININEENQSNRKETQSNQG